MRRTLDRLQARLLGATARRLLARATTPRRPALTVGYVDDPIRPIRLVRAAGVIDPGSIHRLLRTWEHVAAPYLVHLDVQDACITDAATMAQLEAALDHLEHQRIDVRIVGIDPHHPAIAS